MSKAYLVYSNFETRDVLGIFGSPEKAVAVCDFNLWTTVDEANKELEEMGSSRRIVEFDLN